MLIKPSSLGQKQQGSASVKMITAVRILRLLSTRPEGAMTVAQIVKAWPAHYNQVVQVRSTQRYMAELCYDSADGPAMINVLDDTKERRYYLRLSEVAQWFMTEEAALGLLLARQVLERSFTKSNDEEALRRSDMAEAIVASSIRARRLRASLRVVPDGIGRRAASIDEQILASAMDAIADQSQIEFTYANQAGKQSNKVCSPLALVAKDGAMYMVSVTSATGHPIHYALHRMSEASLLPFPAQRPQGFDIDQYIERSHQLSHRLDDGDDLELVLRIAPAAKFHFAERPLSANQEISEPDKEKGWLTVTAQVPNTMLLVPFLVSIGEIEVVGPPSIRKKVSEWHQLAASRYSASLSIP
jgi:predicted DNA-binding transcriptional regulator YafY